MIPRFARGAVLCLALVAPLCFAGAADPLPVTVKVAADHAFLRCGPGDDFYPTERLVAGSVVEVWSIDESGYCAVRPVDGSFSWVRAGDVQPEPATVPGEPVIGVVVTNAAVARVGSQLNGLRHVTQVALEAGERVRILERVRIAEGRHAGEWLRIEAPAGEFRWALAADLALPPELAPAAPAAEPAAGLAAAGAALDAIRTAGAAVSGAVTEAGVAAAAPVRPRAEPTGVVRLLAGWLPRGTNVFEVPAAPPAPPTPVSAGAAASNDDLAEIDLALSLAVTGPTESWNLAPVRERLRLAATRATAQADRARAGAIDARLSRFEAIQTRHRGLAATPPTSDPGPLQLGGMWSSLGGLGSRPIRPGVLPGGRPADGQPTWTPPDQMETSGRLATVVSRRPDAPRWAVVDETNNVIAFVTPQPGVNLAPLVGQQVAVRGARGYMPEYKRPYLVASEARPRIASVPAPGAASGDTTQ